MNTYQICFLLLAACYALLFLFERFTGRAIFVKIKDKLPIAEAVRLLAVAIDGVYPSEYFDWATSVMDAAVNATKKAEDLWKSGEIPKEERGEYCKSVLMQTLEEAGVDTNQQTEEIAQGAIALTCMLLPHGTDAEVEGE